MDDDELPTVPAELCTDNTAADAGRPAAALRIGGITPFSSADWPGRLAAVVFVQGCPWRCAYCHNPHLQARGDAPSPVAPAQPKTATPNWTEFHRWLQRRTGLLDAVVFSGGEPTADPALPAAMAQARACGFQVGLHTAGIYPRRLQEALAHADWVGLDIKAPLVADGELHDRITGVRASATAAARSLALLLASKVEFECRTTAHPALLDEPALLELAGELAAVGVRRWALQVCRPDGTVGPLPAVPSDWPAPATLAALASRIPGFDLRRG